MPADAYVKFSNDDKLRKKYTMNVKSRFQILEVLWWKPLEKYSNKEGGEKKQVDGL